MTSSRIFSSPAGLIVLDAAARGLALCKREPEVSSGHFVQRVGEQCGVLRLLCELPVERSARGELDGQGVARQPGGMRFAQTEAAGIERSSTAGRSSAASLLKLLELQ